MVESEIYFSYGSYMNPERLKERGAVFSLRCLARLEGYELRFNKKCPVPGAGFANLHPSATAPALYGFLHFLKQGSLSSLDKSERVDQGHATRKLVKVTVIEGERAGSEYEAYAYVATPEYVMDKLKPTKDYLGHLLEARSELPDDYVHFLSSLKETALEANSSQF